MEKTHFENLPGLQDFTVVSNDIEDGGMFSIENMSGIFGVEGGKDVSPHLKWSGFPEGTKSFVLTCYDVDAPTGSGFWHWAVANIPASVTELPTGAGDGSNLPDGSYALVHDAGISNFLGSAPPPGRKHRYYFTIHALSVEDCGVPDSASPAILGASILQNTLGRATIVVHGQR